MHYGHERSLMSVFWRSAVSVIVAYLLGSILPAYIIAKLKGFDIRQVGSGNPGTRNAAETMGYAVGVVVGIYDLFKSPVSIILARHVFAAPLAVSLACGFVAIAGHVAPFYLRFRGGRGGAASVGVIAYSIAALIAQNWKFAAVFASALIALIVVFALRNKIPHSEEIQSWLVLSLILIAALLFFEMNPYLITLLLAGVYKIGERLHNVLTQKLRTLPEEERPLLKRKWLRPFAIVFPAGALLQKKPTLILLATVLAVFVVFEILRFTTRFQKFPLRYKKREKRHVSSMVMYLFSIFLTLLLFPTQIASLAVVFVTFGDLLAWSIGISVGGKGFLGKTWSGMLGCFLVCVLASALYHNLGLVPFWVGVVGSLTAAVVEIAPIEDDNFFMSIVSAIVMTVLLRWSST